MESPQEQKSESQDTTPIEETKEPEKKPVPPPIVESMAVPFRAIVPFEYEKLRADFDEYWEMNGHLLQQKYGFKGRKGKGKRTKRGKEALEKTVGFNKLYMEAIWAAVLEKLDNVLFFKSLHLDTFTPERTAVVCVYYEFPEMKLKGEIDFNIERTGEHDVDKAWEAECKRIQSKYRTYSPYEGDETINEDQQVLTDLTATCEGKPYAFATSQGKWLDVKDIVIKTLKEALLNHKKGDLFEISFVNEEEKQIDIQVKIHDVNNIHVPEINDELAKDDGFDSLEALKEDFYKERERSIAHDHVIDQITKKSEIGPVPSDFIEVSSNSMIEQFIRDHRGDKERAMRSLHVPNERVLKKLFIGKVHTDLYQKMARDLYANKYELDKEDVDGILDHMRSSITWFVKQDGPTEM